MRSRKRDRIEPMKQVYQVGMTRHNSLGDQEFDLSIDGIVKTFTFPEGYHIDVEDFCQGLRNEINDLNEDDERNF